MKLINLNQWRQQIVPLSTVAIFVTVLVLVILAGNGVDLLSRVVVVG